MLDEKSKKGVAHIHPVWSIIYGSVYSNDVPIAGVHQTEARIRANRSDVQDKGLSQIQ